MDDSVENPKEKGKSAESVQRKTSGGYRESDRFAVFKIGFSTVSEGKRKLVFMKKASRKGAFERKNRHARAGKFRVAV